MQKKRSAVERIAQIAAAFMLIALPLLFHDKLFDINRFKVTATMAAVPPIALAAALALILRRGRLPGRAALRSIRTPLCLALAFTAAIVASCALAGFEHAVLYGDEGRYCGLFYALSCLLAFFLVALFLPKGDALPAAIAVTAALVGALGALNFAGIDPFRFYEGMEAGQETTFFSTIGHFDFFGTYLATMLGLCGGMFIFGKRHALSALSGVCAAVVALGAACARTESAFIGTTLACFACFALSGDSFARMARALLLLGVNLLAAPAARVLGSFSPYHPVFQGLYGFLLDKHIALFAGAALLLLAAFTAMAPRFGLREPGRRPLLHVCAWAFGIAVALGIAAIVWFSVFDMRELGELADVLRFNDLWGSRRGGVYTRALRAYADFAPKNKLFGGGMELAKRVLDPYFASDPSLLEFGYYNDAHCQLLQMLITCGPIAAAAYAFLLAATLCALIRRAGDDPVALGSAAALAAYLPVMLFNVTQPILFATYFSVLALALSRLRADPADEDAPERAGGTEG